MPGAPVNQSAGPPPGAIQMIFDYSGANLIYTGYAASDTGSETTITVSAASNANPVSFTCTAPGFNYQSGATSTPVVRITGATGNWTPINGVWVATPTAATTFTIPVDSTAFGALTGTLVVTTRSPMTAAPVWAISKNVYSAGNALLWTGWAALPAGLNGKDLVVGSTAMKFIFDNRATLAYC